MHRWLQCFCAAALGFAWSGCGKPVAGAPGAGKGGGLPPSQVVIAVAKRQAVSESLSLVASLAANEAIEIKSETEGALVEINYKEGERVEAGRLLIRLEDAKAAAAVAEAEANFKLSRSNHERTEQLFARQLTTPQELDAAAAHLQAAQAALDLRRRLLKDARIVAPFAGVMGARRVSPGQVINKDTWLGELVDLDPVKAEIHVPERFVSQLQTGQKIELSVAAYPGRKFSGVVFFVAPSIDPVTRTALVKASLANAQFELKPGMFANLELTVKLKPDAVVIPETAVMASGDRTLIFVIGEEDVAQIRAVKLGVRLPGFVEVVEGLNGGERVVAEGVQKARPGGKVAAAPAASAMSNGTNAAGAN